jgi:PTS system nitrogen regulatory IIA component
VVSGVSVRSKKAVLEMLANLLAQGDENQTSMEVFNSLIARERLGSTGLGHGMAIPHGRVECGERIRGAFVCTQEAIDFDAVDNKPVDLFFALLAPNNATDEHLKLLAQLAEMFSNEEFVRRLRGCGTAEESYRLLTTYKLSP